MKALLIFLLFPCLCFGQIQSFWMLNASAPPSYSYDASASAYIAAVQATGVSLTSLEKEKIDTLVRRLKGQTAYGITTGTDYWSPAVAIYPIIGGTAASHAVNLKTPGTFDLTFSGGWTHAATGMKPSTGYANTGVIPNTSLSQNSVQLSYYSRDNTSAGGTAFYDMGSGNNTGSITLALNIKRLGSHSSFDAYDASQRLSDAAAVSDTRGLFIASRTASNAVAFYRNGSALFSGSQTAGASRPTGAIYIGAFNEYNTGTVYYNVRECAYASIRPGMSATDVGIYSQIINAFQTSWGRNTY